MKANERVGFKAKEIKDEIIKKSNTLWRHCGKNYFNAKPKKL